MAPNIAVRLLTRILIVAVTLTLGLILSIPPLLQVIWRIIKSPRKAFAKKKRTSPPAAYLNPALGRHEVVNVNGVQYYYVAAGNPDKPLMLLLHGFPECWYSWRHQLKYEQFRDQYRIVAVDLRGYGRSSKPSYFHWAYHPDTIAEDVHQLIGALGYDSCVLVAHDWGGNIAYRVSRMFPESVDRLIVMDLPEDRIFQSFASTHFSQIKKSLYIALFQLPFLPEFILSVFDYGFINQVFRSKPVGVVNREQITDEDIEVFKWNVAQRRTLTGGLNYYRCIPSMLAPLVLPKRKKARTYAMPVLVLWGDSDVALDPAMAKLHEDSGLFDDITTRVVPSASHWVQQDQPELVNQIMLTWLISKDKQ